MSYQNYNLDDGGDDGNSEHFRAIQPYSIIYDCIKDGVYADSFSKADKLRLSQKESKVFHHERRRAVLLE